MAIAGVLALIVLLLLAEAAVFAVASFGLAMHWACLTIALAWHSSLAALFSTGDPPPPRSLHRRGR
jgi:hypothetical protein